MMSNQNSHPADDRSGPASPGDAPWLLFDANELRELSRRRRACPRGRQLFYDLMASADWARKQPIPPEPPAGPAERTKSHVRAGESPYREDYLLVHEAFETVTAAYERAVLQCAFVYRLTGQQPWADRAIEWMRTAMHEWKNWGPGSNPLDQFAVRVLYGSVLGCDWLGEAAPDELLRACRQRAAECAARCVDEWGASDIDRTHPWQVSNHHWFNTAMLGMTSIWLGRQNDSARDWRSVTARCAAQLGKLCEWTIGPDGDYLDKPGFLLYALRWALPTMVALHRAGHEDLLARPVFAAAARWLTDMLDPGDMNLMYYPSGLFDRWILFLLASRHRLGQTQWAAEQSSDAPMSLTFATYDEWFRSGSLWSYLFYDETLAAQPPDNEPPLAPRHYRSAGWVAMGAHLSAERPKVLFHAGPASGKNFHDQGHLLVSAFGERLLEIPQAPAYGYLSSHRALPYMMSNLSGHVLDADGLGQASGQYPHEWPLGKLVGHEVKPALGCIERVESGSGWAVTTADLTRAYQGFADQGLWGCTLIPPDEWRTKDKNRLRRYVRHIMLARQRWIIVQDEIETNRPMDLEWHFGTHGQVEVDAPARATIRQGRAAIDVYLISPAEAQMSARRAHVTETGKFLAIRQPVQSSARLLLVMHVRRSCEAPSPPVFERDTLVTAGNHRIRITESAGPVVE